MANEPIQINNHSTLALNRLVQQYKGKSNLENFILSFVTKIQELETVLFDLLNKRSLDTAEGVQLDGIGEILNLEREPNETDDAYRLRLKSQIVKLISNGEPETLIRLFNMMTNATQTHFEDLAIGSFAIMSEIALSDLEVLEIWRAMEEAAMGGCRVEAIGKFDTDNPFVFEDGGSVFGGGFGDTVDPLKGGKLATIYNINEEFSFGSIYENQPHLGFGDVNDSVVGARLT